MADEIHEALEALALARKMQNELTVEVPAQPPGHDMAAPENQPAADAAFAEDENATSMAAGWFATWGGSLLLNDIDKKADETEEEQRDRKKRGRGKCC